MLLSRDHIKKHMAEGNIIIDPFDPRKLQTASYDVELGEWYWRERHPEGRSTIHNVYDEDSSKNVWEGPFQAELAQGVEERTGKVLKNIHPSARVIMLGPGETILAHTNEFIGGLKVCIGKMYARSSLGRNFIEVCKDAGWGDVGYFNRWTMEVTNNSQYFSIPLVVGRRIAQMVFYEVQPISDVDNDYVRSGGKYQAAQSLEELKATWSPRMMVPRMHIDWEIQAGK